MFQKFFLSQNVNSIWPCNWPKVNFVSKLYCRLETNIFQYQIFNLFYIGQLAENRLHGAKGCQVCVNVKFLKLEKYGESSITISVNRLPKQFRHFLETNVCDPL